MSCCGPQRFLVAEAIEIVELGGGDEEAESAEACFQVAHWSSSASMSRELLASWS